MGEHGDVEAGKMEDLEDRWIQKQSLELRRRPVFSVELHEVRMAVPGGQLHHTQTIAPRLQTLRLGIHGHRILEDEASRQVVQM